MKHAAQSNNLIQPNQTESTLALALSRLGWFLHVYGSSWRKFLNPISLSWAEKTLQLDPYILHTLKYSTSMD